jgi:hypothetical protein
MATAENGSSSRPSDSLTAPRRIFAEEFLAYLAAREEPETAAEAEVAGPCHIEPDPQGGWAVLLEGESIAAGNVPRATFLRKEAALVAAAVLPGTARRLRYRIGDDPCERGFPVLLGGATVGHCRVFYEALAAAMTVVDALLASPGDFASVLEAMGWLALERVQRITAERIAPHP